MISYSQFCPVAKAAEVFGDRWTPIIIRELCFGTTASCTSKRSPKAKVISID
jgi:DNA-binding HxlR family transcriptional regulator